MIGFPHLFAAAFLALTPIATTAQTGPADRGDNSTEQSSGLQAGQMRATDCIDREVHDRQGNEIGEVEDLIIEDGRVVGAIVEIESRLGIGARHVSVPLSQLRLQGNRLVVDIERQQLEALPTYRYRD